MEYPTVTSPDAETPTVRLGKRLLRRFDPLGSAMLEALAVSRDSHARAVYVIDLRRYFEGERDGFVIVERLQGRELAAVCAIVAAL